MTFFPSAFVDVIHVIALPLKSLTLDSKIIENNWRNITNGYFSAATGSSEELFARLRITDVFKDH